MKKPLFLSSLLAICLPLAASAQEVAPKAEIFGGYSYLRADTGAIVIDSVSAHGFNTSLAGNITKHIGIVGEFSRFTVSQGFTVSVLGRINVDSNVVTYLFGPRITPHRGKSEDKKAINLMIVRTDGARVISSSGAATHGHTREDYEWDGDQVRQVVVSHARREQGHLEDLRPLHTAKAFYDNKGAVQRVELLWPPAPPKQPEAIIELMFERRGKKIYRQRP